MGWGAVAGIASSVIGGALGSRDGRKAAREQRAYINAGLNQFGDARDALTSSYNQALAGIDEANMVLAGIEPAILAGMDEQLRVAFANQLIRQEQDDSALRSQMASAGLDSTTAMAGVQRTQRLGQGQALGNVSAQFAGQRAGMLASARGNYAQGLMNRAGAISNYGSAMANTRMAQANFLGGIQVQPANTGAGIGAIGGQISNALFQQELMGLLQGGGSSPAANLGNQVAAQTALDTGGNFMANFLMGGF